MQGAVGIFNIDLTANLLRNLPVKFFKKSVDFTELWSSVCGPAFLAHPALCLSTVVHVNFNDSRGVHHMETHW